MSKALIPKLMWENTSKNILFWHKIFLLHELMDLCLKKLIYFLCFLTQLVSDSW